LHFWLKHGKWREKRASSANPKRLEESIGWGHLSLVTRLKVIAFEAVNNSRNRGECCVIKELSITTRQQGLHNITREVESVVAEAAVGDGLCTVFVQHTSASLIIQENADPSARKDLENWLNRLVPEHDPHFSHTQEGPDDMPSHIKSALTASSLSIPVVRGQLALGVWQGIYLWEHRRSSHHRRLVIRVGG